MDFKKTQAGHYITRDPAYYIEPNNADKFLPMFISANGDEFVIGGKPVTLDEAKRICKEHAA